MLVYAYKNNRYVLSATLEYMQENQIHQDNALIIEYEVDDYFSNILHDDYFSGEDKLIIARSLAISSKLVDHPYQVEYFTGTSSEILPQAIYESIQWLYEWFKTDDTKVEMNCELRASDKDYIILLQRNGNMISILINGRTIVKQNLRPYEYTETKD